MALVEVTIGNAQNDLTEKIVEDGQIIRALQEFLTETDKELKLAALEDGFKPFEGVNLEKENEFYKVVIDVCNNLIK